MSDDVAAVLREMEAYDTVRIPLLDAEVGVLDALEAFGRGTTGVRAADDGEVYVLAHESNAAHPDLRVDRWDGTSFSTVLRAGRIERDGAEAYAIPSGVTVESGRRTGGRPARADGGQAPAEVCRELVVGQRVRVVVEDGRDLVVRVKRGDGDPDVARDLYADPRYVYCEGPSTTIRLFAYRIMNGGDRVHAAASKAEGGWAPLGRVKALTPVQRPEPAAGAGEANPGP